MAFWSDFTLTGGNLRHVSGTTVYSIYDVHAALQDWADDASGRYQDNPSELAGKRNSDVPMSMTLLNSGPDSVVYNITSAELPYIKYGSISQAGGDTLYSGLKTIGGIVTASPIYVVQNGTKLTKFWGNGHIQILIQVKTGGALIDSGNVMAYSRKYGQTYSNFEINLSAGSETSAAIETAIDKDNDILEATVSGYNDITLTFGDTYLDLGNGNGSKLYKGVIDIKGRSLKQAYNYFKYITREGSTYDMNGVTGEQYLKLNSAYTVVSKSPLGTYAGGSLFMAQGWALIGVTAEEATKYELTPHDGTTQVPPSIIGVTITNTVSGDAVVVARADAQDGPLIYDEYTLASGNDSGDSVVVINGNISADTPSAGYIRVDSDLYAYTSWTGSTFTLSGTLTKTYTQNVEAYVPFIDTVASGTSVSNTFIYSAPFWAIIMVRNNASTPPMKPFITWQLVGSTGASVATIRNADA